MEKTGLPGGLRFRRAVEADQPRIVKMVRGAHINPIGLKWPRFLVVEGSSGEIVGLGQIKPHRDGSRELASLVVAEARRGQGLGRALVHELKREAGPPLWLMCRSTLVPFYAQAGFAEVLPSEELPPTFRRMREFVHLLDWLRGTDEYLAFMVWRG